MAESDVILYGPGYSTYTRTSRLTLEEKGVRYRLVEVDFLRGANKTPEHLSRHPFGKVPVLDHGDLRLYETAAIIDYIDSAFPGTALQPKDARAHARMLQVIGIVVSYLYAPMVGQILVERMIKPLLGQPTDQSAVDAGIRRVRKSLGVLEQLVEGPGFLIEGSVSLADLYLVPMWAYFLQTPEGQTVAPTLPRLASWWTAMSLRPSVVNTEVPLR
ncbi:MAG: glutathione S-transferase family protein [Burkholderiales bacterium]